LHYYSASAGQGGGSNTVSGTIFPFGDPVMNNKYDPQGILVGDTLVIKQSGLYSFQLVNKRSTSQQVDFKINGTGVAMTYPDINDTSTLAWLGTLTVGDVLTVDTTTSQQWQRPTVELTQLPTHTITTLVDPTLVTPESLDHIQVELSVDANTVLDGTRYRTPFDVVTNAGSGSFTLNADGTVTLAAGGRYKINAYSYTSTQSNPSIYDFTNDVELSPWVQGAEAADQVGSLVTIVSPSTDINVGLGFRTTEVAQGDSGFTGRCSMLVESIGTNTVTTPGTVVVDDQAASGYFDIGTMRMQWGTIAATAGATSVVYPAAFSAVPTVTSNSTSVATMIVITSISATSVGLTSTFRDGGAGTIGDDIHWQAFGLK
jgi:hypothetical protein